MNYSWDVACKPDASVMAAFSWARLESMIKIKETPVFSWREWEYQVLMARWREVETRVMGELAFNLNQKWR